MKTLFFLYVAHSRALLDCWLRPTPLSTENAGQGQLNDLLPGAAEG
jgi:hypothetical protein